MQKPQRLQLIILAIILSISILALGCKPENADKSSSSSEVAARVGSTDIPLSKVDRVIEQGLQGSGKKLTDLSAVQLAAARLQALETLITKEVLYQRAHQENIQVSEEDVHSQVRNFIQSKGLSSDDYQKMLKDIGMTEDEFNEEQRREMTIGKLKEKFNSVKPPTDREISDFYNNNPEQFKIGKGVNISQIVVDAADNKAKNDAIGEDQAKQKIDSVYAQLKGGGDFATVARIQSEDPSAIQGGDLGFHTIQELQQMGFPPQLTQAFFNMKEGDITPPIEAGKGQWYIFKLTGKRTEEEKLTLDSPEIKARISQGLLGQRKEILDSALISSTMAAARIDNYLAQRMLQNPDNFGALRPASSDKVAEPATTSKEATKEPTPVSSPIKESTGASSTKDTSALPQTATPKPTPKTEKSAVEGKPEKK